MFGLFKKKSPAVLEQDEKYVKQVTAFLILQLQTTIEVERAKEIAAGTVHNARTIADRDFPGESDSPGPGERFCDTPMGQSRLANGVTKDEIAKYWSQPPFEVVLNDQMELARLLGYTEQSKRIGNSSNANIYQAYLYDFAMFSTPENFRPEQASGLALTEADAPLYPEIRERVEAWIEKEGHYAKWYARETTSLNAHVRKKLAAGII